MDKLYTYKDLEALTGNKRRALQQWEKGGKIVFSGESRRNAKGKDEHLFYLTGTGKQALGWAEPAEGDPGVGEKEPEQEYTFADLCHLRETGEITERLAERWKKMAYCLFGERVGVKGSKDAVSLQEWWGLREAELVKWQERLEKWELELESIKEAFAGRETDLKTAEHKVALVKIWCAETVRLLLQSEVWEKEYQDKESSLPGWPEGVSEQEVTTAWVEGGVQSKKKGKARKD